MIQIQWNCDPPPKKKEKKKKEKLYKKCKYELTMNMIS